MHTRFQAVWSDLSPQLQQALAPYLEQDEFPAMFTAEQVNAIKTQLQCNDDALALALLPVAAACAVAPISNFKVGAVARGESGNLYFGANMEFAGAPLQQTVHAEQSAVTHAWLRGESRLISVTVNYTPCGHCRQFMNELNSGTHIQIQLPGRKMATLGDYLPDSFGPKDLNITSLLMDKVNHGYKIDNPSELAQQALQATNRSHAPYSESHSGIAVQMKSGKIFQGSYAENAAFNPSLPPLQAALILLNMAGESVMDIESAVLIEKAEAILTQWDATQATLMALGCRQMQRITL
ncbi:cytidine deaminase [Proteus faecis]|uniref:Cytidine deaminase n=1 Tax=Proteus faecis TaxID=2050967 RepID=A0AAW7CHX7_9GAMM|nr:cytidine deaminase [Proteus faecis]MBG3013268.1 cytidine deaminase [Proteus mirabilis]QNH66727.1 cytidine deaminase [Proteus vulgaris]MDL5165642.1 cytidine deaminase [Proteus faecis]MDL5274094.1 cytidine deaminase [Proteus faecis]MDL5277664.1 cytidine deaminase [Proteus faecis]